MKPEVKFGINVALLIVSVFLFNIVSCDYNILDNSRPFSYYVKSNLGHIQSNWMEQIFVIAIITIIVILICLKKKYNLWDVATKAMWLSFVGIVVTYPILLRLYIW